jgi:hypothetical protein
MSFIEIKSTLSPEKRHAYLKELVDIERYIDTIRKKKEMKADNLSREVLDIMLLTCRANKIRRELAESS